MKIAFRPSRILTAAGLAAATLALGACYIVPIQPGPPASAVQVVPGAQPAPLTFTARLYPSNELASPYGMVGAIVTNDLNGRGHFTTEIGGESFAGESTRIAGSSREGVANGSGNHGGFINCRYAMNSPTLGTGNCRMSNGATFAMHFGS
jgi:hypothetical protein